MGVCCRGGQWTCPLPRLPLGPCSPCPAQDGEGRWEMVGELGGGSGERCFRVRNWAEAEGWGESCPSAVTFAQ